MTSNITGNRDVIVSVTQGFASVQDCIDHLNAPPLRADKAERLMEFANQAKGNTTTRLIFPHSRTNDCIRDIQPVYDYLLKCGYQPITQNFEENSVYHSTKRTTEFADGATKVADLTSADFIYFNTSTNLPEAIANIDTRVTDDVVYYSIKLVGEHNLVNEQRTHILANYTVKKPVQASVKVASAKPDGSLSYSEVKNFMESPELAHHSFYPWMNIDGLGEEDVLTKYFQEFLDSSARVLILIGPPGVGKSTFIRTLIAQHKVRATLAYTAEAIGHPSFIENFTKSLEDNDDNLEEDSKQPNVLVMEDSDEAIRKRELGNRLMADFLNVADGIASHKGVKMIFSTNLASTRDIDTALMRPGRCFDILPFTKLTAAQARVARAAVGLPEQEFDDDGLYTLSEALNKPSRHGTPEIISPRFGFVS